MRTPSLVIGALLVIVGLMIAAGVFRYTDKDKVIDFGKIEVEATHEKKVPLNWGYLLIGSGAVVLVAGALAKKS